ncbi:CobQ/CobB/MinD/ParA nucleotide binding domain protein (plasmid) [Mycobacterium sp. THAF192]|nr:CobQ/CobB/MinD/ParA nucleotide binding domain protein [Mycobacterium sp. THAF192]
MTEDPGRYNTGPNHQPEPSARPVESTVAPPPVPAPPPLPPAEPPAREGGEAPTDSRTQAHPRYESDVEATREFDMPAMPPAQQRYAAPPPSAPVPAPPLPETDMRGRHSSEAQGGYSAPASHTQAEPRAAQRFTPATRSARTSEALAHVQVRGAAKLPPERGWRRWLLLLTRINMGLSPDEIYERELHTKIRRIVTDPQDATRNSTYQVGVISLKGGVGKTAISVLLGSVLAEIRAGGVLAIDADPDAGNLIERARKQSEHSIAQVVATGPALNTYNSVRAHTSRNDANLEVLAAHDYVDSRRPVNGADWHTATQVVSPFYSIILADCGNGLFNDVTTAVLDSVWGLVLVTDTSLDAARKAGTALDWLRVHGYHDLLNRTVIVINHREAQRAVVDMDDIKAQFAERVGEDNVFEMPFDSHVHQGEEIQLKLVGRTVLRRATEIAAALSTNFDRPRRRVTGNQ